MKSLQLTPTQAAGALVLIMVMRMFGLFVAIPILTLHTASVLELTYWQSDYPLTLSQSGVWLGLVMGGYGLMSFIFQIPSGLLSDRYGRRPIIIFGLMLFITGSVLCEIARDIEWLALGRLIQGIGAVSAATTALLADLTTPKNRVRWMALMGVGISISFIAAFVFGPKLYGLLRFQGFFLVPAYLSVVSIFLLIFFPNKEKAATDINADININAPPHEKWQVQLRRVLFNPQLISLNAGVFFLHASMVGVFVAIPWQLEKFMYLPAEQQWRFYLWIVPSTLILALIFIWPTQKTLRFTTDAKSKAAVNRPLPIIPLMISLLLMCLWGLSFNVSSPIVIIMAMLGFFLAFNILEALQPALVSFIAPPLAKGAAMGVYHSCQSLGLFVGGFASAWIFRVFDAAAMFRFNAAMMALWLAFALFAYFQLYDTDK